MKIKLYNALGRMLTISSGMLFALGIYSGNRIVGYTFFILFYIACLIDTAENDKGEKTE